MQGGAGEGCGTEKFAGVGEFFYRKLGTWGGMILTIRTFLKVKTAFCEYWTLIKIKITMIYVYKEYEIKTKMVQEHWLQLRMKFLLGYNMKFISWCGEINIVSFFNDCGSIYQILPGIHL